jgi:hypothetical protein
MDRHADARNRHDIDGILALHTEDSVFENHTSGGKAVGLAEFRALRESVFSTLPDLSFERRDDTSRVTWSWSSGPRAPRSRAPSRAEAAP